MTAGTTIRIGEPTAKLPAPPRQPTGGWPVWRSLVWKDILSARYPLGFLFLWHLLWAANWIGAWAWRLPGGGAYETLVFVEKYRLHVSLVVLAFASASLFLADRRRSPTAFWRTRPPAPLRVAASKLIVLGVSGCAGPGLVTFASFAFTGLDWGDAAALGAGTLFIHSFIATLVASLAWLAGSWTRLGTVLLGLVVLRFILPPLMWVTILGPIPFGLTNASWWTLSVWLCLCLFLQTRLTKTWPAVLCLLLTGPAAWLGMWATGGFPPARSDLAKALPPAPWSVSVRGMPAGGSHDGHSYSLTCEHLPAPAEGFLSITAGTGASGRHSASWDMPTAIQRTRHAEAVISQSENFSGRWFNLGRDGLSWIGSPWGWDREKAHVTALPQRISGEFVSQWARLEIVDSGTLSEQPLFLHTGRIRVRLECQAGPGNSDSEIRLVAWLSPAPKARRQIHFPAADEIVMAIVHPADGWGCIVARHGGGRHGPSLSSEARVTDTFHIAEPVTPGQRPQSGVFSGGRQYRSVLGATVFLLQAVPAGPAELCTFDLPVPAAGAAQ